MTFVEKYPQLVQFVTILGLIGIPSIFTLTVGCIVAISKFFKILNYLMAAVKSQIRADLIKDYDVYIKRESISQVELDEWFNRFSAYTNLVGPNEVLHDRSKKILTLRIEN